MALLSSLADWGNKAVDWYKDNPIVSDVLVPGGLSLYNTSQQKGAISGATGQRTAGIEQGLDSLNQFYGTARQDAAPYMQGGLQGLGQYQALLDDPNAVKESEDYKFRFGEGQQALERSAAAKGMLLSGNTLQDLQQYGQGFATRELDAALQRRIPLIETGLTSQQSLSNLGGDYARAIASLYGDIGEAEAQGTLGRSTATTGTLSDTLSILEGLGKGTGTGDMVTTGAEKLGSYLGLGSNAAPLAAAGLGGTGLAGFGTTAGTAAALGTGGFGAELGAAGLGGAGIGGATTLPGMGGTAAAFEGMTSGIGAGVGTGGSTAAAGGAAAGSIGLLSSLGIAGGIIGLGKALGNLSGGASDRNKVSEAGAYFQRSPQEGYQNLDNIINNDKWANEWSNVGVINSMVDQGVINVAYPTLHSANSIIDVWNNTVFGKRTMTSSVDAVKDGSVVMYPTLEAQVYGLSPELQQQYVTASNQLTEAVKGVDRGGDENRINYTDYSRSDYPQSGAADSIFDVPAGAYVTYYPDGDDPRVIPVNQLPGYTQVQDIRSQYMTEDHKRDTAQKTYQQLRNAGYTGDLSKLEAYLRDA